MRTAFLALFFCILACNLLIAQDTSDNSNSYDIDEITKAVLNIIGIFITLFFKRPRVLISAVIAINLLFFHSAIISSFPDEESAEIIGSLIAFICLMCFIFYFIDQNREKSEKEYFRGKNIFHRYGKELLSLAVPIGHSNDDDSLNRVISLRDGFYQPLEERIKKEYENFYPFEIRILDIQDLSEKFDKRKFLQITFKTHRHTTLFFFIYFESFGKQILLHYHVYIRGRHYWDNALNFMLSAPFHMWFWIGRWLKKRYSIANRLNTIIDESYYNLMDIESILKSVSNFILSSIREISIDVGILSEDAERLIAINIDNSTKFHVKQSKNVSFENVSNKLGVIQ